MSDTRKNLSETPEEGLALVLSLVAPTGQKRGSNNALAALAGVSAQAVSQWQKVPLHHVPHIAEALGLDEYEIRPDHYRPKKSREFVSAA